MYAVFLVAEDGDYCKAQGLTLKEAETFIAAHRANYGEGQYLEIRKGFRDYIGASERMRGEI